MTCHEKPYFFKNFVKNPGLVLLTLAHCTFPRTHITVTVYMSKLAQ